MKKVILDFGHGTRQYMHGSKQSPDGTLYEGEFVRKIGNEVARRLRAKGYEVLIPTPEDKDVALGTRVNRINKICGKDSFLVSIHANASGNGQWMNARGFSVFVSKNASAKSKEIARKFTDTAIERKMTGNRDIPDCKYWTWSWTKKDLYILKNTTCPAVMTENFYYDNKLDLLYQKSDGGFEDIVKLHVDVIESFLK